MNTSQTENALAVVSEPKLRATLNGGSDVLDSARIPVQFGVNAKLAEIQPTHILVVIQHRNEVGSHVKGIRYLIPLGNACDFIAFDSAGEHVVTFIALKYEHGARKLEELFKPDLSENAPGQYCNNIDLGTSVDSKTVTFENTVRTSCVVAKCTKTVSLPEGLFAKKSSHWIWRWANLWHRYAPRDECQYRKRLIWAFTGKPLVWFLVAIIAKFIWQLVASAWQLTAKVGALILGWRPTAFFKDFNLIWSWHWSPGSIDWDITRGYKYGVWKKDKHYPVTGLFVLMAGSLAFLTIRFCLNIAEILQRKDAAGAIIASIFLLLVLAGLTIASFVSMPIIERLVEKWDKKQTQTQEASTKLFYFEWLQKYLSDDKLPEKVDLAKVPRAFTAPGLHRFKLSFEAQKAKMCKQFPRN